MVEWEQGAGGGQLSEMWNMKTDTPHAHSNTP